VKDARRALQIAADQRRGLRALAAGDLKAYLRTHAGDHCTGKVNGRSEIFAE
jgi:hypothetical protein